jgi:SPP1 family predicted phage head-tail adaptor
MATRVRIGVLRHLVQLQEKAKTPDGGGGNAVAWSTYASVWGRMEPKSGNEPLEAGRLQAQITHELTIRYHPTVSTEHRVFFKNRPMQIRSILNMEERGRWMVLGLEEGVAS